MYQIDFDAADVEWQIQMLAIYPEIANKHFYPAMHRATDSLAGAIEPNIPHKTGLLQSKFRKAVSGKGLFITAKVGFPSFEGVAYVVPLEYGAKPHPIGYVPGLGVTIRMHPGMPAKKFMARGIVQTHEVVDPEMEGAMRAVVNELAKDS